MTEETWFLIVPVDLNMTSAISLPKESKMQTIHGFIVALHVLTGALSLLLFWVPSFTRKGGKAHKQFGGYYIKAMLFTSISGVISSTMVLFIPLVIYPTMPEHFEAAAPENH